MQQYFQSDHTGDVQAVLGPVLYIEYNRKYLKSNLLVILCFKTPETITLILSTPTIEPNWWNEFHLSFVLRYFLLNTYFQNKQFKK